MSKNRLEAFSDGVIAILITIMVLELKVPERAGWEALRSLLPVFSAYVLSFVYLGIYWNNHHHMFHMVHQVTGGILWANLHLLFWLSLVPFTTHWVGEGHMAILPTLGYGGVLFCAAVAYYILQTTIVALQGKESRLREAIGRDWKGKGSVLLYVVALPLVFIEAWISMGIYVLVALIWLVPDKRIENRLSTR
jgi:uncharacterized membrane protein